MLSEESKLAVMRELKHTLYIKGCIINIATILIIMLVVLHIIDMKWLIVMLVLHMLKSITDIKDCNGVEKIFIDGKIKNYIPDEVFLRD